MPIEKYAVKNRAEWLGMRSLDLTASDVAAAAGVDPYKSALQLYGEKAGLLMPAEDTPQMQRGRWLEPAVLEAIGEQHPDWVLTRPKLYLRDPATRLGATPDCLADIGDGLVTNIQCKVVSRPAYERGWSDGPPLGYVLQTLTEGMLLAAARSKIAALVIDTYGAELKLHDVERHAAAERRVEEIAELFWRRVIEERPPPADYRRDAAIIEQLHPTSQAEPVLDLSGDNALPMLLPEYASLKLLVAAHKERMTELEAAIKDKMGDAERGELPGWKLSWKTQHRKEHVVKAASYRVLRVHQEAQEEEQAA